MPPRGTARNGAEKRRAKNSKGGGAARDPPNALGVPLTGNYYFGRRGAPPAQAGEKQSKGAGRANPCRDMGPGRLGRCAGATGRGGLGVFTGIWHGYGRFPSVTGRGGADTRLGPQSRARVGPTTPGDARETCAEFFLCTPVGVQVPRACVPHRLAKPAPPPGCAGYAFATGHVTATLSGPPLSVVAPGCPPFPVLCHFRRAISAISRVPRCPPALCGTDGER